MATIASLIVNLGLNSASFATGLNKSKSALGGFAKDVKSFATSTTGILTGAFAAVGVGLSMHAGIEAIRNTMEEVDKLSDRAKALGVTTDALSRLQYAAQFAGMASDDVAPMLAKMSKSIFGLAQAGEDLSSKSNTFAALGLSMRELSALSADKQFEAIAEAISKVENPTQRMGLAMGIFGKNAAAVMPLLLEGREGLEAWFKESDKFGNTVSPVNAQMIKDANDNVERLGRALHGVALIVTAELAPFIKAATQSLIDFSTSGTGVGEKVVGAFEWVLKAVAKLADWMELLKGAFYSFRGVASLELLGVIGIVRALIEAWSWLQEKLTGTKVDTSFMDALVKDMAGEVNASFKAAGESFSEFWNGTNSAKVTDFFDEIRAKARQSAEDINRNKHAIGDWAGEAEDAANKIGKVKGILDGLQRDMETFGMTEGQKRMYDLKNLDADPAALNQAKAFLDELDQLNAHKKLADEGKQLTESLRTPMEQYEEQLKKLDDLRNAGAIDAETYNRGLAKAQEDLNKTDKPEAMKKSQATEQRFAFTYRAEKPTNDPMTTLAKAQLEAQKRAATASEATAKALVANKIGVVELE